MTWEKDGTVQLATDLRACQAQTPRSRVPRNTTFGALGPGGLLVHLHYYESASLVHCELVNKRLNLAQLIEQAMLPERSDVSFHVTTSGADLPDVEEFYTSIGAAVPKRESLFPPHVNFQRVANTPTDLCPRVDIMRAAMERPPLPPPSYALFLNDGARGPYISEQYAPVAERLGVPLWLARFMEAFAEDDQVHAVGSTLSCEVDVHVQSWAIMIDWRAKDIFMDAYNRTCDPAMSKLEAIRVGEVGAPARLLSTGGRVSSFFGDVRGITQADRDCLESKRSQLPHLECSNPYSGQDKWTDTDIPAMTFIKLGGEPWRLAQLPTDYLSHAHALTTVALGLAGPNGTMPEPDCCCTADERYCEFVELMRGPVIPQWMKPVMAVCLLVVIALLCWTGYRKMRPDKSSPGASEKTPLATPLKADDALRQSRT